MRPIFLTSACASTGVIPMLLGGSSLWMPMAAVIFWGTIITMFFILTVMPVAYWRFMGDPAKKAWQRGKDDVKITNRPVSLSSCRRTGPFYHGIIRKARTIINYDLFDSLQDDFKIKL